MKNPITEHDWLELPKRRRHYFISWATFPLLFLAGGVAALLEDRLSKSGLDAFIIAVAILSLGWVAVHFVTFYRLFWWKCPGCRRPFLSSRFVNLPYAANCRRCGLPCGYVGESPQQENNTS